MKVVYPQLSEAFRLQRLQPHVGKVKVVLDTDTFNEIDDQFAIVYALLSQDKIDLQAVYAAPFYNQLSSGPEDGMEKSYEEALCILERMNVSSDGFVFKGSTSYLPSETEAVDSEAARDLVKKAMAMPDDEPLYVVAIGAITNVASAILLEPRIIEKIVVIWLGGHILSWRDTKEFNLIQDIPAARVLLDSGVPFKLIPCHGVASHLITTLPEINYYVRGRGRIGDFLAERYEGCSSDHFGYSRVIWDISAIAYLVNPDFVPMDLVHSPVLTDQGTWSQDTTRHLIHCASAAYRNDIFKDFFRKLEQFRE